MVRPYNDIDNKISLGVKLLNESVKLFNEGDIDTAHDKYIKAGEYLNEAKEKTQTNEGKNSLTYGDNLNFGIIYKVFESNALELLSSPKEQVKLKKVMNLIKENKVLFNQFLTYNAFTNPVNVKNITDYVNEAMALVKQYTPKELKENNEKIVSLFKTLNLNENVNLTTKEVEIFENIEYMLLNKKNFNNINKFNDIQKQLCEHVEQCNVLLNESESLDVIYEKNIQKIVEKFEGVLNDSEVELLEALSDTEKAKQVFTSTKENVVKAINEQIKTCDNENKKDWQEILEQVNKKQYSSTTILEDMYELIEINNEINS